MIILAQTDITGVIGQLSSYYAAAVGVGISVLVFCLGRIIVAKVAGETDAEREYREIMEDVRDNPDDWEILDE